MNLPAGYVGANSDQMKIQRFEKQREEKRKQIEIIKKISNATIGTAGTRQFALSKSAPLEQKFGEETAGLVTKAVFIEKRRTLQETMQVKDRPVCEKAEDCRQESHERQRKRLTGLEETKLTFFGGDKDCNFIGYPLLKSSPTALLDLSSGEKNANNAGTGVWTVIDIKDAVSGSKKAKIGKDPCIDTSFLPDQERDKAAEKERETLKCYWKEKEEQIKSAPLDIIYSFWDGTGHRRKITVRKGDSIGQFLIAVQKQLAADFREVRTTTAGALMYVKEDIIIPHRHTFYELILNKVRGKSGPLLDFGKDTVVENKASRLRDEPHAGKVVERHWYDKNKHIFPASRWEIYDVERAPAA